MPLFCSTPFLCLASLLLHPFSLLMPKEKKGGSGSENNQSCPIWPLHLLHDLGQKEQVILSGNSKKYSYIYIYSHLYSYIYIYSYLDIPIYSHLPKSFRIIPISCSFSIRHPRPCRLRAVPRHAAATAPRWRPRRCWQRRRWDQLLRCGRGPTRGGEVGRWGGEE